jgi:crotonobetainyl-CoA:carnitine CoA-transferase CaiB-like acyl-CoA transferase
LNDLKVKSILESFKVLDLTDQTGSLCSKILADLGADVIKIEKPAGNQSRNLGPFFKNKVGTNTSLHWFASELNKRGITLDIETKDGQQLLLQLVSKADFVIESFPVGYLEELNLGYSSLNRINPRLIMTSISPFGQTGPYKNYKASDIVVMAMGGFMYITGNPDEPPLRVSLPQAFLLASAHAAAATMVAHYYREASGIGQYVDVSAQQCVLAELSNAIPLWALNQTIMKRAGSYLAGRWGNIKQRLLWPCKDGFVIFYVIGGKAGARTNRSLFKWMDEEQAAPDYFRDFAWDELDMAQQSQEMQHLIEEPIGKFFLNHTKEELFVEGQNRDVIIGVVSSPEDLLNDPQLSARKFWLDIEHKELGETIQYPGPFIKASETPVTIRRRAPLLGEHNLEIYEGELGLSRAEVCALKQAGVI